MSQPNHTGGITAHDISGAQPVNAIAVKTTVPPLIKEGVVLAKYVLGIISAVLLILFGILTYLEWTFANRSPEFAIESIKATREFWAQIAQMTLLNLLLPVLTALLGYIFASNHSNK